MKIDTDARGNRMCNDMTIAWNEYAKRFKKYKEASKDQGRKSNRFSDYFELPGL